MRSLSSVLLKFGGWEIPDQMSRFCRGPVGILPSFQFLKKQWDFNEVVQGQAVRPGSLIGSCLFLYLVRGAIGSRGGSECSMLQVNLNCIA
jgi:hypothetical protein